MRKDSEIFTRMAVIAGLGLISQACNVSASEGNLPPTPIVEPAQTIIPEAAAPFSAGVPLPGSTEIPTFVPYNFYGVDFSKTDPISFNFEGISSFSTIPIVDNIQNQCDKFIPGTGTSCEDIEYSSNDQDIIHFIHSGRTKTLNALEGEGLRRYFEGYVQSKPHAINTLEQIQAQMDSLIGNKVTVAQDGNTVEGVVKAAYRLNPAQTAEMEYTSDLIPEIQKTYPGVSAFLGDSKQEVFVMFCGWALPNEPNPMKNIWYSWSRYIIVVGPADSPTP